MLSSSEVKDKQYIERIRGDLDVQDATDDRYSQIRSEDAVQKQLVDRKLVRKAQKVFGGSAMLSAAPQQVEFANRRTLPLTNKNESEKQPTVSNVSNKYHSYGSHVRLDNINKAKHTRKKNAVHAKHSKQHYERKKSMTEKSTKKDNLFNQDILDLQQVKCRITKVIPS